MTVGKFILNVTKFGGHPNEEGCAIWTQVLYEEIKHFFDK